MQRDGKSTLLVEPAHLTDYDSQLGQQIFDHFLRFFQIFHVLTLISVENYLKLAVRRCVQIHCPNYLTMNSLLETREFWVSFHSLPYYRKYSLRCCSFTWKLGEMPLDLYSDSFHFRLPLSPLPPVSPVDCEN